jgi:hypothetical protein
VEGGDSAAAQPERADAIDVEAIEEFEDIGRRVPE